MSRLVEAASQLSAATTDANVQSDLDDSARSIQQAYDELKHKLSTFRHVRMSDLL